jgi:hypothetical protein
MRAFIVEVHLLAALLFEGRALNFHISRLLALELYSLTSQRRGSGFLMIIILPWIECLNFCFFLYSLFIYLKINYCLLSSLLSSSRSLSWKVSYSSGPCRIFMDLVFLCVSSPHSSNFHFMNLQGSKELITLFRSSASSIVVTFGHHIPW